MPAGTLIDTSLSATSDPNDLVMPIVSSDGPLVVTAGRQNFGGAHGMLLASVAMMATGPPPSGP